MIKLPPEVKEANFSKAKLLALWNKVKDFDRIYSDWDRCDELAFYDRILSSNTHVLETENGILIIDNLLPNIRGQVHVIFWDKKLSNKTAMLKQCIAWAFDRFQLERMEAVIPEFARALRRFMTEKLHFTFEGRLRKRMLYKGEYTDSLIFSLIREEILQWEVL